MDDALPTSVAGGRPPLASRPGFRDIVDLREAKAGVQRLFPPGHPLRETLMREPDELPRNEARSRLAVYLRLACAYRRA